MLQYSQTPGGPWAPGAPRTPGGPGLPIEPRSPGLPGLPTPGGPGAPGNEIGIGQSSQRAVCMRFLIDRKQIAHRYFFGTTEISFRIWLGGWHREATHTWWSLQALRSFCALSSFASLPLHARVAFVADWSRRSWHPRQTHESSFSWQTRWARVTCQPEKTHQHFVTLHRHGKLKSLYLTHL